MGKKLHVPGHVKGKLHGAILKGRRETVYKMIKKRLGFVPCFVCQQPVEVKDATLEHIIELRNGGTDEIENLSISHGPCNWNRRRTEIRGKDEQA